ncbi:putative inner membrane protein [Salmonella enterica]|nr:putative inner membrane protein [Salmonella enterica]SUH64868.1 putative inner membrane protein [Salmonella enterica subsp. enterica serovar Madelia]
MLSPTTRNMGASLSPQSDVSGELNTEALTCIVERLESEIIDAAGFISVTRKPISK